MTELNKSSSGYWALYFPKLPIPNELHRDFVLNIFGTGIPSISTNPIEHRWQGAVVKLPGGTMNFNEWTFNFIVDEKLLNWQILFKWLSFINNNKDKFLENYPNYCISPTLQVLDNFKKSTLKLQFINAWPIRLGEITLNTRQDDTVLEGQCTLTYDRFEFVTNVG